jgi:hypothetical protein
MNKKNNINKEILLVLLGMIIVTLILLCVRYYNRDKVISEKIRKNEIKTEQNERLEGDILKYANIFNEKSKVKKKEEKIYNNKKIKTYIFESGNKIEIYDDGRIKNYINVNELETFKTFEKNEFNLEKSKKMLKVLGIKLGFEITDNNITEINSEEIDNAYSIRIEIKKDNIIITGKAIVNPNFNNVSAISLEYNEMKIQEKNNKITKEEAISAVKNSLKEEGEEGNIIENKIKEKIHSSSILNKAYNVIEIPVMMEYYKKMMEGKIDKMPEYSRLYEVDIETGKVIDIVGVQ